MNSIKTNKAGLEAAAAVIAASNLFTVRHFIGLEQKLAIRSAMRGEEGEWFSDKLAEIGSIIAAMPKTYGTENVKDKTVHLHYFTGGCDWYIIELDSEDEQHQAYGLADIGYGAEMGYISIVELLANGAELDLHFKPRLVSALKPRA